MNILGILHKFVDFSGIAELSTFTLQLSNHRLVVSNFCQIVSICGCIWIFLYDIKFCCQFISHFGDKGHKQILGNIIADRYKVPGCTVVVGIGECDSIGTILGTPGISRQICRIELCCSNIVAGVCACIVGLYIPSTAILVPNAICSKFLYSSCIVYFDTVIVALSRILGRSEIEE